MTTFAPYAKALIGALVAALGALGAALTPDADGLVSVTPGEWVAVVSALLVGLLAVFAVPNKDPEAEHQDESVQPPYDSERPILGKAIASDLPPTVESPGGMRARDYGEDDPHRP